MLDLKFVIAEQDQVKGSLERRGANAQVGEVDQLVQMNEKRKSAVQEVETLKHERNLASQEIAKSKKSGADAGPILDKMKTVSGAIKDLDLKLGETEQNIKELLHGMPNVLDESVPAGSDENDNIEIRTWGDTPDFSFEAKSHYDILENHGLVDFKKAGEVAGSRFAYLKGRGAALERALIQFMIQTHLLNGYEEILPPYIVNRDSLFGTGQLPKFEDDVFRIEKFDYFLNPTAEVAVTNYHRNEILELGKLPIKYVAFSPCFRSEAGSYGKDTKGLKRQHQFHKVELVKFCTQDDSFEHLESLTKDAESILKALKLPYRVVQLCGGDVGFSSSKTYDIEVWSPFEKGYMEISSCSNFLDFQARRANIRYRPESGKPMYVHTLNGSGLAVGRTLIAIVENFQTQDGDFNIPEVLAEFMPTVS